MMCIRRLITNAAESLFDRLFWKFADAVAQTLDSLDDLDDYIKRTVGA